MNESLIHIKTSIPHFKIERFVYTGEQQPQYDGAPGATLSFSVSYRTH